VDAETLFLLTCHDLEQRVSRANGSDATLTQREYEALMIAPLLRKLLLDRQSLIDRVNRTPRLKIRYPILAWPLMAGSGGGSAPLTFDTSPRPILEHFLDRVILDRDEMLSRPVMVWNDKVVSARDVIAHQANAAGGVHLGAPRSEKGRMLLELDQSISFGGIPAGSLCVMAVGRAVLLGLEELRRSVQAQLIGRSGPIVND
jgi:hypothetical protein